MTAAPISLESLYGTWRLVRAECIDAEGRPIPSAWGPKPDGRLALDRSGRMMAVLCDGRASIPEGETRAYSSYCGNFVVEDNVLTTTVDAAAIASRIGGKEVRRLEMRDGFLILKPPPRADGERRELYWERVGTL